MAGRSESAGYRRGVVLGFTVAEVVLLFVFCLLLLLAPTIEVLEAVTATRPPGSPPRPEGTVAPRPGIQPTDTTDRTADTPSSAGQPGEATRTSPQTTDSWADIPPDWPILVEGQQPFIAAASICAMTGLSKEDCVPARIQEVLRGKGEHNWPPIIRLREADGQFFAVGSVEITEGFARKIKDEVIPMLVKSLDEYKVDVVEVVGHTDEQPIQGKTTNLDSVALDVVRKGTSATRLTAADNAGLGYARAISIAQELRNDPRLSKYTIIPLSAAQLVDTSGKLSDGTSSGNVKERRRIEIRVRRSDAAPATVR